MGMDSNIPYLSLYCENHRQNCFYFYLFAMLQLQGQASCVLGMPSLC